MRTIAKVRCVVFAPLCSSCQFGICCDGVVSSLCQLCPLYQRDGDALCPCLSVATDKEIQTNRCVHFEPRFTKHEPVSYNGTIHYFEGYDTSRQPLRNVIVTADADPTSIALMSVPERQISHITITTEKE